MMKRFDAIIIGAGAAGLMCALTAGQRGRRVLVVDHAEQVGKKILISGGGHCNFTNLYTDPANFVSDNPHFCISALNRFKPRDFIALVEKHRIPYHEKKSGQLFCRNKASAIVTLLTKECQDSGVIIQTRFRLKKIERVEKEGKSFFTVESISETYETDSLVIATGGLSFPKTGASDFGYRIAKQFGIGVRPCRPGLVSLTLKEQDLKDISGLAGTSADVLVTSRNMSFRDSILFTHKGLSGPAILQISNYWEPGEPITINFLPDMDFSESIRKWKQEHPNAELQNLLNDRLTRRLILQWLSSLCKSKPINQYSQKEIAAIRSRFCEWRIIPSGTSGFSVAEVTKGGVDTKCISSKTFETHSVKGLYFIGEVLDVTGWLGGYNFQWAWASGKCAGLFV